MKQTLETLKEGYEEKYGFHDAETAVFRTDVGLNEKIVKQISAIKKEPQWMLDFRIKSLTAFRAKKMPSWGADLSAIDFDKITYYLRPTDKPGTNWEDVPQAIKNTFEKLGIPEAEQKFLGGVGAQYDSESVYHKLNKKLEEQGVVFLDMDSGLRLYPELVKKYFGKIVPFLDNKFAALNSAVWSGGSFVYIPKGVHVEIPLQAYFRINAKNVGQFERTLIIADEGSSVHYVEGCFTKGTPITTQKGIKPIEEIEVGDSVLTHKGHFRNVYATMPRNYSGKLYSIDYYGDPTQHIEVTEEHPVLAVEREKNEYKNQSWEPTWAPACTLKKGDYLAIPINRTVVSEQKRTFLILFGRGLVDEELTINTDADFFRLIGYYLAEGSIVSGHYLHFTFNEHEREYLDDVKHLTEKYFGKAPFEQQPYKGGISLVLSSTRAARFFQSQFGKGAAHKHLPSWVLYESTEKQKELVKAYWRGDGSFKMEPYEYGVKRMFRINTISAVLARQIRDVLLRLNIFCSLQAQKRAAPRQPMYCLYVGGSFLPSFSALVELSSDSNEVSNGQTLKQLTAKSFAHISSEYAFMPIKELSWKIVEKIPVYNFAVEEDESYVANGVAVHNCTAPVYSTDSLHVAVVELVALKDSKIRYTTIQNWSNNVYNLVTKRAYAYEGATVEWIDGNLGSKATMKYPSVYLMGRHAKADILSVAFAGSGQHQDAGGKVLHFASDTTSNIISKSISMGTGRATYRGQLRVEKGARNVKSQVNCDALLINEISKTDTYPYIEIEDETATIGHEATVGKIGEDQIFYLMSRGLTEAEAKTMIVQGFIAPFTKLLPMEYAVELNRLISLEMEGSVG